MVRDDKLTLEITDKGEIKASTSQLARRLAAHKGRWRLLPQAGNLMLLQRIPEGDASAEPKIALAGEILGPDSLPSILSFIHMSQWDGSLALVRDQTRKILFFRGGQLLAAASNLPEERLGALLVRFGQLGEEQLAQCVQEITPTRRLGAVLVDQGLLTSHQLYEAVRRQSEEIFYSALPYDSGAFYFSKHLDESAIPARLHLDTQNLLLEGLRRIDELSHFRSKLPSGDARLVVVRLPGPEVELDSAARVLLRKVDGTLTLDDLAKTTHLGEFAVTKAAFALLQAGFIAVRQPETLRRELTSEKEPRPIDIEGAIIAAYSEAFVRLYAVMSERGQGKRIAESMASFSQGVDREKYGTLFDGVQIGSDGALPTARLRENAQQVPETQRSHDLQTGLNEMLFFALFVAGDAIDRAEEQDLQKRVAQALERLQG